MELKKLWSNHARVNYGQVSPHFTWQHTILIQGSRWKIALRCMHDPWLGHSTNAWCPLCWRTILFGVKTIVACTRLNPDTRFAHNVVPGEWNSIWKIKAPSRLKKLIWHICREFLPTRMRLQSKERSVLYTVLCTMMRRGWLPCALSMYSEK